MSPARAFERVRFHGFERGCGILETLSGEVHLQLREKRLALLIVFESDGHAALLVRRSRLHHAKFRARQIRAIRGSSASSAHASCAAPPIIRASGLSSALWVAALAATLLREFRRTQISRFTTSRAFSSMNLRRSSTFSPISVVKISSAATTSSSLTLQQRARLGVHRGFPELLGIHFAQALEPRDGEIFLGVLQHVGQHVARHSPSSTLSPLRVTVKGGLSAIRRSPRPASRRRLYSGRRRKRPIDSRRWRRRHCPAPIRRGCAPRRRRSLPSRSSFAFSMALGSFSSAFLSSKSAFFSRSLAASKSTRRRLAQPPRHLGGDQIVLLHVQQELRQRGALERAPSLGFTTWSSVARYISSLGEFVLVADVAVRSCRASRDRAAAGRCRCARA